MSDLPKAETVPAWSVRLANGGKVTMVHIAAQDRVVLEFERDEKTTTVVLSQQALNAVVQLAISRAGVPVLVDGGPA